MKRTGRMSDHLKRASRASQNRMALVGILENKTYPDGPTVAQVGLANEYGTTRIPPRPFFRTALENKRGEAMLTLRTAIIKGRDVDQALLLAAEVLKDEIVGNIITWSDPPNAPSTIAAKGYNAPLRGPDRLLRNSISTAIVEDSGDD